jgi:hypothetical protein
MSEDNYFNQEEFLKDPFGFGEKQVEKIDSFVKCIEASKKIISKNKGVHLSLYHDTYFGIFERLLTEPIYTFTWIDNFKDFKSCLSAYNALNIFYSVYKKEWNLFIDRPFNFYCEWIKKWQSIGLKFTYEQSVLRLRYLTETIKSFEYLLDYIDKNNAQVYYQYRIILVRTKLEYFNAKLLDYLSLLEANRITSRNDEIDKEDKSFIDRLLSKLILDYAIAERLEILNRFLIIFPVSKTIQALHKQLNEKNFDTRLVNIEKNTSYIPNIKENTDLLPEIKENLNLIIKNIDAIQKYNKENLMDAIASNNLILVEEICSDISKEINLILNNNQLSSKYIEKFDINLISSKITELDESSKRDIAIAEYLIDKLENYPSLSILQICKVLEREIILNIFVPFRDKVKNLNLEFERPSFLKDNSLFKKDAHKISYEKLYYFVFKNKELTLGNFGRIISVAVKHEEFELFKELKSFIEQQYPNNHDNIYKLIRQISDDKMIFKVSLSELRNFCAHPKDLLNDKIDAIITKDQYYKVKSFLFSPPTQLLIQLLNKDGSF